MSEELRCDNPTCIRFGAERFYVPKPVGGRQSPSQLHKVPDPYVYLAIDWDTVGVDGGLTMIKVGYSETAYCVREAALARESAKKASSIIDGLPMMGMRIAYIVPVAAGLYSTHTAFSLEAFLQSAFILRYLPVPSYGTRIPEWYYDITNSDREQESLIDNLATDWQRLMRQYVEIRHSGDLVNMAVNA